MILVSLAHGDEQEGYVERTNGRVIEASHGINNNQEISCQVGD